MDITGIILAGGESRRMGSDKGLVRTKSGVLIETAVNTLSFLCNEIIISTNNPDLYKQYKVKKVKDEHIGKGPLAGIEAGLNASLTKTNVILAVDMPGINSTFLEYMILSSGNSIITIPVSDEGVIQPLCGVYKRKALPDIKNLICHNTLAAAAVMDLAGTRTVKVNASVPGYNKWMFANINQREDIINWEKITRRL